jgi:hypothetical protein
MVLKTTTVLLMADGRSKEEGIYCLRKRSYVSKNTNPRVSNATADRNIYIDARTIIEVPLSSLGFSASVYVENAWQAHL